MQPNRWVLNDQFDEYGRLSVAAAIYSKQSAAAKKGDIKMKHRSIQKIAFEIKDGGFEPGSIRDNEQHQASYNNELSKNTTLKSIDTRYFKYSKYRKQAISLLEGPKITHIDDYTPMSSISKFGSVNGTGALLPENR